MSLNFRGASLVESLVAAGLVSVSALGLSVALQSLFEVRDRFNVMGRAVAIESALVAAMVDQSNYPIEVQSSLRAGQFPSNFVLNLEVTNGTSGGSFSTLSLPVNNTVLICYQANQFILASAGATCLDESYRVRVQARDISAPGVPVADRRFAFAYYLSADLAQSIGFRSFGAITENFQDSDFRTTVPLEVYRSWDEQSCGASELLIRGVVRNSGQPICMLKDDTPCPAGSYASGLEVVGGVMRLRCSGNARQIGCPANYNLQSFNPRSLAGDLPSGPEGVCVYAAQNSEGFGGVSGIRLQGQVCPTNYALNPGAACVVQSTQTQVGSCTQITWVAQPEVDEGRVVDPGNPANDCNRYRTSYVQSPVVTEAQPLPGQLISSTASGNSVNCEIQVPPQPCNAQWEGHVAIAGSCELQVPETVPAIEVGQ